jgi:hypothetical protein
VHLAARTPAIRRQWIQNIQAVIQRHDGSSTAAVAAGNTTTNTTGIVVSPPRSLVVPARSSTNTNTAPGTSALAVQQQQEALQDLLPDLMMEDNNNSNPNPNNEAVWQRPNGINVDEDPAYENLDPSFQEQIKDKIQRFLPVMEETTAGWHCLFERGDGHAAYSKDISIADSKSLTLIKSTALLDHPPRQLLNLLLDSTRRGDFETNMKAEERLARLNPYTVLDYYSYEPVWPTSSREFAVATHWQVLQKGQTAYERALLLVAFSCPEADALRPTVEPRHVRAELLISMVLSKSIVVYPTIVFGLFFCAYRFLFVHLLSHLSVVCLLLS